MKRLGCLLLLVLSAAACGGSAGDTGGTSSRVFEVSTEPRTLAAGTRSFASLGGITVDLPDSSIVFVGTNCLLFQTPSDAPQMGVVIGRFDQDSNGNVVETLDDYFSMNEGAIERTDTGRTFDLFGTTLKGYSAEEVGPIEEALSCAPVGQDVDLDVTARFSGRGAQWLADAEEGGVYMAGWVSINRDFDEEASQLFDEILSTVEVTEG